MNNLLLLFDSLPVEKLGCYGGDGRTASINSLAANGDLFTFCFSDQAGQVLVSFVADYESYKFADIEEFLRFDFSSRFHNSKDQTLVLRFGNRFNVDSADQVVKSVLENLGRTNALKCNTVFTSLQGFTESEAAVGRQNPLGEMVAHVPLIVATAGQNYSRRRSLLLATPQIVQLIGGLFHSIEKYEQLRDSLDSKQLQYRNEGTVATRTNDWLLIRETQVDEHGEHLLALFRKPEDVWEILNVADQYPQLVEHFSATGQLTFPDDS